MKAGGGGVAWWSVIATEWFGMAGGRVEEEEGERPRLHARGFVWLCGCVWVGGWVGEGGGSNGMEEGRKEGAGACWGHFSGGTSAHTQSQSSVGVQHSSVAQSSVGSRLEPGSDRRGQIACSSERFSGAKQGGGSGEDSQRSTQQQCT